MSLRINIAKYPVFMKIGYYVGERIRGQEVLVSLTVELVKPSFDICDNLEKTTNYAEILEKVDATLRDKEMKLIETAVENLGQALLEAFPQIANVNLTIEKPILPDGIGRGARVSVSCDFKRMQYEQKTDPYFR